MYRTCGLCIMEALEGSCRRHFVRIVRRLSTSAPTGCYRCNSFPNIFDDPLCAFNSSTCRVNAARTRAASFDAAFPARGALTVLVEHPIRPKIRDRQLKRILFLRREHRFSCGLFCVGDMQLRSLPGCFPVVRLDCREDRGHFIEAILRSAG